MVKTVTEQRGWQHSDHAQLLDAVATIAAETGDEDIDRLFEVASIRHTNFYEGWYGTGRVERGLRDIEIFIDKLQPSVNESRRRRWPPVPDLPAPSAQSAIPHRTTAGNKGWEVAELCANSAKDGTTSA